jgi:predicted RNA binding protein with dsRBD fold (UPF0201 family)
MKNKIAELLKKLFPDREQEIEDSLKDEVTTEEKPVVKQVQADDDRLSALTAHVKALQDALAKEQTAREAAMQSEEQRVKTERETKVSEAVNRLFADKKITEADKPYWNSLFAKDYESAQKATSILKSVDNTKKENAKTESQTKTGNPVLDAVLTHSANAGITNPVTFDS